MAYSLQYKDSVSLAQKQIINKVYNLKKPYLQSICLSNNKNICLMNFNNFTIKSQEAIQKAVEYTREASNQVIEPVHLLKAVVNVGDSLVNFIFQKILF